jgi:hypothetical protein
MGKLISDRNNEDLTLDLDRSAEDAPSSGSVAHERHVILGFEQHTGLVAFSPSSSFKFSFLALDIFLTAIARLLRVLLAICARPGNLDIDRR